ncbi:MAG: YfcE family phosphodiesterase [Clostridia bacterium]|nr:YfcE family phosphodiesterase [Clostridia bacterium]
MKCLCFSDSHGSVYYMKRALALHPDCEVVFFLGDGLSDIEPLIKTTPGIAWLAVRGNCDHTSHISGGEVRKLERITLEGVRIAYTHGDLYGVKYGFGGVLKLADDEECDVVLFGHTHEPIEQYKTTPKGRGVYLFNPGSIGMSFRGGASYGVMLLREGQVLLSHGELN